MEHIVCNVRIALQFDDVIKCYHNLRNLCRLKMDLDESRKLITVLAMIISSDYETLLPAGSYS